MFQMLFQSFQRLVLTNPPMIRDKQSSRTTFCWINVVTHDAEGVQSYSAEKFNLSFCSSPPAAAAETLRENHQPGRQQEEQEGHREEGGAGEGETRSGEHEEEQTAGHQVSTTEAEPFFIHFCSCDASVDPF